MRWIFALLALALATAAPASAAEGDHLEIVAAVTLDHAAPRSAATAGITIIGSHNSRLIVRGSPSAVTEFVNSDHVTAAQQVWAPVEAVTSEGLALVGANAWGQSSHPRNEVRVAIVDTGFAGLSTQLGVELPAATTTRSFRFDGLIDVGSGHGTAVAEIVHDVAPGARLYLVAVDSDIRVPDVVDYLIDNDIDIVNMSIGWTQGPYDGSAAVSQQVSRAVAAGITWVNAAGNEAQTHWSGAFVDTDNDAMAEFAGSDEINRFTVAASQPFTVDIAWKGTADLDLCLYSYDGGIERFESCSVLSQGPGDRPAESIAWLNLLAAPADFGYSVRRYSGAPGRVDAFIGGAGSNLEHSVEESSLLVPSEVPEAIAVGAVPWYAPQSPTSYSSRGPALSGAVKPDFVGPTAVSTSQIPMLGGTSAASPHVAGVAALLLEVDPALSPAQLKTALAAVALPLAAGEKSNLTGWGRSHAGPMPGVVTLITPDGPQHDSIAVVDTSRGIWDLRLADGARRIFYFGNPGDVPISGDWDCDGVDSPGMYRPADGWVYLRNRSTQGVADISYYFGNPGDRPLAGDFNGDGCDTVSMHRPSSGRVFIVNELGSHNGGLGAAEMAFTFGDPLDNVVAADFDADGRAEVGVYRDGVVHFRTTLDSGPADGSFAFGEPGDIFVAGNWTGTGSGPGAYRPSLGVLFYKSRFATGPAEGAARFGNPSWYPVAGFWGS